MAKGSRLKGLGSADPRAAALTLIREWGREGGKLRMTALSSDERRALARKAAAARWRKERAKKKA